MKNGFLVQGGAARQSLLNYISLLFGDYMIQNPIAKSELLDLIYPIGSVYINVQNVSPENFIGGVWEQIQGRFLLAMQNGRYTAGDTGGEETHTLLISEMPTHRHGVYINNGGETVSQEAIEESAYSWMQDGGQTSPALSIEEFVGGNQPHNNMPPYLVVYMWQRTE